MPKDTNNVKRLVYIGTQYDDKIISQALKRDGFRRLVSVRYDEESRQTIELSFSEELDYKPRKRVVQISKKKHKDIHTEYDIISFINKEKSMKKWTILENIEFPQKWLIFLTE